MMNGSILIQDIKKNPPSLYGIVMTNSQLLETKLHIKFSENDIAYITMLISNAMEEDLMNFKIALITRKDYNTSKYQQHKIEKNVAYLNSIELYFYDHMDFDFDHYDSGRFHSKRKGTGKEKTVFSFRSALMIRIST